MLPALPTPDFLFNWASLYHFGGLVVCGLV